MDYFYLFQDKLSEYSLLVWSGNFFNLFYLLSKITISTAGDLKKIYKIVFLVLKFYVLFYT